MAPQLLTQLTCSNRKVVGGGGGGGGLVSVRGTCKVHMRSEG